MTDLPLTDTRDTRRDAAATAVAGLIAVGFVVAITGTASLLMSFHGLRDLVQRVEDVSGWLSNVGPVGIDGLQLSALVAILITATAPLRVRVYLWAVFLGSIGLSVAGNCVDASARQAGTAGVVLSGVWPALLASATHVAVVAVRWWLHDRSTSTPAAPAEPELDVIVLPEIVPFPGAVDVPEPVEKAAPTEAQIRARARTLYRNGRSCKQTADEMTRAGVPVSAKQVERWTKDLRNMPAPTDAEPDPVAALNNVNIHRDTTEQETTA